MGYYTHYKLNVYGEEKELKDFYKDFLFPVPETDCLSQFREWLEDSKVVWENEKEIRLDMEEPSRWYEHNGQMARVSEDYPSLVFVLYGYGEEQGDVWKKRFKNGKIDIIKAKVVLGNLEEEGE